MENCKVVNIPEKRFLQERGGRGQGGRTFTGVTGNRVSDHCPGNMYIKVPLKIGFLDIKIATLLKQICLKILTISAVQVFSSELISPIVLFSRIFFYILGTPACIC